MNVSVHIPHACSLLDLSILLWDILICKENKHHQKDGKYKESVIIKAGKAGLGSFPQAQMDSKTLRKTGCHGEDSTMQAHQPLWCCNDLAQKIYLRGLLPQRCWGKRQTKGRKLQCLQTAGQFRTKSKIICSDINQGSLQTGGSQAELGLQKGSV